MPLSRILASLAVLVIVSGAPVRAQTPDEVAYHYGFVGAILIGRGADVTARAFGTVAPSGGAPHRIGQRWRLASVTKQIAAALLVRRHPSLDTPLPPRAGLPTPVGAPLTLRQLLTHHTGLSNPSDTPPDANGVPSFYLRIRPDLGFCATRKADADDRFRYNNCDYLYAAAALGGFDRWPRGLAMARSGERGVPGFIKGSPEPEFALSSYGAAGGLIGTARDLWRFDRDLMEGKLLSAKQRDALWQPEGHGSYQALGAWVFPATLRGCSGPKRVVQRDGEILGVQVRNFILPDDDLVVIAFTNRSADDFAFGEIWQRSGFSYDLITAVACGQAHR